jgi:hypothetical protein
MNETLPNVIEDQSAPFRYLVRSKTGRNSYLVDLTERDGLGRCSCVDFETRANPNHQRHGRHIPYPLEGRSDCKHLFAAKAHFYLHTTVPMLASMKDGITSNVKAHTQKERVRRSENTENK